jgi:hypothetical protein
MNHTILLCVFATQKYRGGVRRARGLKRISKITFQSSPPADKESTRRKKKE